jgi:predicted transcriptional regulator of viral defense system
MSTILDILRRIGKAYYTVADLGKVTGLTRESLYVTLTRLVRRGLLVRLTSGIYILPEQYTQIDVVANILYQPSYLSFESALSRYGVLSQIPYVLTFATTAKSTRRTLGNTEVEYRSIKKSLFFGYEKNGSLLIASPEKAVLDTLYFVSFGKLNLRLEQLDLKAISKQQLRRLSKPYPPRTLDALKRLLA